MPGIVGIISRTSLDKNKKDLNSMIGCMMHESFYVSGSYINDQLGLYSGWVSHEGSFADCMPVYNEKKDIVLLFSGENFMDENEIDQLKNMEHEFDDSNASYLVHLYEEKGEKFLQLLNGCFHGIIIDLRKGKAVLFNDRYGLQRIYYHENKNGFFFASEAKSLLEVCPELRQIDFNSLGELVSCGCVMQNRTLFNNISLLPSGSAWTFQNGINTRKELYFEPHVWENQPIIDDDETFYKRLRETFINILPRYFHSKEKIALSLTGGIDTRMILANVNISPGQLPCYTFSGMYRDSYDVKIAREVAAACKQSFNTIECGKKFLSNFPKLAEKAVYITDGSLDLSGACGLYANSLAREIAPIRMTGNSGQEVFMRKKAFKSNPINKKLFNAHFVKYIQNAEKTLVDINRGHDLSFVLFKQAPWYQCSRFTLEQSQLTIRTPYLDKDLISLMYQAPEKATTSRKISLRLIAEGSPKLYKIITDRRFKGSNEFLFSEIVRLYREFIIKMEYFIDHGLPQRLNLKKFDYLLTLLHLEKLFIGRTKFYNLGKWFRGELSKYVQEILFDERTLNRPYLNKVVMQKMVNSHIKGYTNYADAINQILTLEFIQRLFIEYKGNKI